MQPITMPKLAVWKFSSCDGCQLSLLDCEDELLAVAEKVEIAYFLEATRAEVAGPYDISIVEGSITTEDEAHRIQRIRASSKILIAIGACATAGGIQGLKNNREVKELINKVYAHPEFIETLENSTPVSDHVQVDFELRGCPIDKYQLLEALNALLNGRAPNVPTHSQCMACKLAGHVCVMVARGTACLGPVTQAGCGSICPEFSRGCFGCFGPSNTTNTKSLGARFAAMGLPDDDISRLFRMFCSAAPAFDTEARNYE